MGEHTKGPWLAAARPSSVVGWPVVAPRAGGRMIAEITHVDQRHREFNAESDANGRLIAASPTLYDYVLRRAEAGDAAAAAIVEAIHAPAEIPTQGLADTANRTMDAT